MGPAFPLPCPMGLPCLPVGLVSLLLIPHLVVVEVMVPEGVDDAVDLLSLARQAEGLEEQADGGVELDVAEVKRLSVRVKSLGEGKCGIWVEVWG